jgi:hypothetical protein
MYNSFFYQFYKFSSFIKSSWGPISMDPHFDAVMILTILELINFISFGKWLKIPYITTSYYFDIFLLGICIFGFNIWHFLYKKKYIQIIEKCKNDKPLKKSIYGIIALCYTIGSWYFIIFLSRM